MTVINNDLYTINPKWKTIDFIVGFITPISMFVSAPFGPLLILFCLVSITRKYIWVGIFSSIITVLLMFGTCIAGLAGGANIEGIIRPSNSNLAGISGGIVGSIVAVLFIGVPLVISIVKELLKRANKPSMNSNTDPNFNPWGKPDTKPKIETGITPEEEAKNESTNNIG